MRPVTGGNAHTDPSGSGATPRVIEIIVSEIVGRTSVDQYLLHPNPDVVLNEDSSCSISSGSGAVHSSFFPVEG